jgi:uncharacterized protein (UPF0276 family)
MIDVMSQGAREFDRFRGVEPVSCHGLALACGDAFDITTSSG